jgi:hypothetical protein
MPARAELILRAASANVDYTLAKYANDSVLEQAVIYAEKAQTAQTGTATTKAPTADSIHRVSGGANV